MKKNEIMTQINKTAHRFGFKLKKHSPEILVVAGVIGMVTSAVMACRSTTKIHEILDEAKDTVDTIHNSVDNPNLPEEYTKEDEKKDLTIVYAKTGMRLIKLYGPSIVLGTLSVTSIFASSNILRKRNVALAAAYATVDKGFKEYKERVIQRFGEAVDKELTYGVKAETIGEKITDEDGNEQTVKKTVLTEAPAGLGPYAKIFDECNPNWERNSDYNASFLRAQQAYANQKFMAQGYLFLNDVYKLLGFNPTKAGQTVGWIFDPEDPSLHNYVDFGMLQVSHTSGFINGIENSIILNFNVDGNILNSKGIFEE